MIIILLLITLLKFVVNKNSCDNTLMNREKSSQGKGVYKDSFKEGWVLIIPYCRAYRGFSLKFFICGWPCPTLKSGPSLNLFLAHFITHQNTNFPLKSPNLVQIGCLLACFYQNTPNLWNFGIMSSMKTRLSIYQFLKMHPKRQACVHIPINGKNPL